MLKINDRNVLELELCVKDAPRSVFRGITSIITIDIMFTFLVPTFLQSSRRKKKCLLASRFHLYQCNITKCQCYWLVMLLHWIQRRAVICYRSSTICRFIWKQWIICLTSLHLKDCMLLVYVLASLSYDGISGSSQLQLPSSAALC